MGGLLMALAALMPAQTGPDWLTIEGEKVLPEEVYRAVLQLPPDAKPDLETASIIEQQLSDFLERSGYELAEVDVDRNEEGGLRVTINEGRLEKVVFIGRLTLQTLRLKLALDIPHDVFNRPALERQVHKLEKALGLSDIRLVLRSTPPLPHRGPQLTDVPEVKGFELLHERRPYELEIILPEKDWDTGLGADVRIGYVDGLVLALNYQGKGGLLQEDRWRVSADGGAGLRNAIGTEALYAHFSRAALEGHYFLPPSRHHLRPAVELTAQLLSRQRRDLNLENYFANVITGALWLEWEPTPGIRLQAGGGVFYRRLFALSPGNVEPFAVDPGVEPDTRTRPFGSIRLDFTFDPGNERWDRHHLLQVELHQQLPIAGNQALAWASYRYQVVVPFGWHDLWIRTRGYATWYQWSFHDEQSLGELLRGVFGRDYVLRGANLSTEFRFSITRDIFKLSLSSDVAIYSPVESLQDTGQLRAAFDFGPGAHFLLEGLLQLDMYFTVGVRPVGTTANPERFTLAASAQLQKAF
jgi:hypothetical protein